jgi:hypothetical protein
MLVNGKVGSAKKEGHPHHLLYLEKHAELSDWK